MITDRYPGYVRHQLVELGYLKSAHSVASDSVAFNIQPRKTGQILIGSSRQYGDETSDINQAILSAMLQRAAVYMPSIGSLNAVRVWTGFRAATPDKLPLIGPSLHDDTVWLATGHEGLGITTSLATGELLAAALTAQKPRFRWIRICRPALSTTILLMQQRSRYEMERRNARHDHAIHRRP